MWNQGRATEEKFEACALLWADFRGVVCEGYTVITSRHFYASLRICCLPLRIELVYKEQLSSQPHFPFLSSPLCSITSHSPDNYLAVLQQTCQVYQPNFQTSQALLLSQTTLQES